MEELDQQPEQLGTAPGELRDHVADPLADLQRVAGDRHDADGCPQGVADLAVDQGADRVAHVADREQADEDLAQDVLVGGAHRVVVVGAEQHRRAAAHRSLDRIADVAVVGERVVVGAVEVPVAVGVGAERVGVALELVEIREAVAVGVGAARVGPELELLGVREAVAVGVGELRVGAVAPLLGV